MGQSRVIVDRPAESGGVAMALTVVANSPDYKRYRDTRSGAADGHRGTPGVVYTADGRQQSEAGIPAARRATDQSQLRQRERKLAGVRLRLRWADIEGEGSAVVVTSGSVSGAVREAVARAAAEGRQVKLVALRRWYRPSAGWPRRFTACSQVLSCRAERWRATVPAIRAERIPAARQQLLQDRPGPLPLRPAESARCDCRTARRTRNPKSSRMNDPTTPVAVNDRSRR